ncbi:MAG TPA: hypothetical protein VK325_07425 [Pseudoxanthomonas sp.]|nr:hypothetical protein [Pseudoxanthomonas sp.]
MQRQRLPGDAAGLAARRLQPGDGLYPQLFELAFGERRVAQDLGRERQRFGQLLAPALQRDCRRLQAAADAGPGSQRFEALVDLLARQLPAAAHQHAAGQAGRLIGRRGQAFDVAETEPRVHHHGFATGLLRQQRDLERIAKGEGLGARLQVLRRRVEVLARAHRRAAGIALHQRGDIGRGRYLHAVGSVGGDEAAQGAVAGLQVLRRHPVDVLGGDLLDRVAGEEQQAPVAGGDELRQPHADRIDVGEIQVVGVADAPLGFVHLPCGNRALRQPLDLRDQLGFGLARVAVLGHHRDHAQQSRVAQRFDAGAGGGG